MLTLDVNNIGVMQRSNFEMASNAKKFFIHYSHFFSGGVLSVLLNFISFPILTRVLTTAEYGIVVLINTTMSLTVAFAKAGLSDGIIRYYNDYSATTEQRDIFCSTIIIRGVILSSIVVLFYVIIFPFIRSYIGVSPQYLQCFMIMSVYLFIRPLNIIILNLLRINGKTLFLNVVNLIGKAAAIGLSLFFMLFIIKEFYGFFIGLALAELILTIILAQWFFSKYKVYISKTSQNLTISLIKFGLPLLFSEVSYLLLSYFDRFMIIAYHGEDLLGLYSVGYNLSMYIGNILVFSLNSAVIPIYVTIFHEQGREETENFLAICFNYLMIGIIPICFGYYAVSKELFILFASEKYAAAAEFSPIILLGTILLGMNGVFNAGLYLKKKTTTIFIIIFSAVLLNILLNIILLPEYKIIGAAYATLISCGFATILTIIISFKHISIKINYKNILYHVILSTIMFFAVISIELRTLWICLFTKIFVGTSLIFFGILLKEKQIRLKVVALFLTNK